MKDRNIFIINEYSRDVGAVTFYCFRYCLCFTACTILYATLRSPYVSIQEWFALAVYATIFCLILYVPINLVVFIPLYLTRLTPEVFTDYRISCAVTITFGFLMEINNYLINDYFKQLYGYGWSDVWPVVVTFIELIAMLITYHFIRLRMIRIRQKRLSEQNE